LLPTPAAVANGNTAVAACRRRRRAVSAPTRKLPSASSIQNAANTSLRLET
jgi:hypothetical protein